MDSNKITAFVRFGLVAAACLAAASIWASSAETEEAFLLDATTWQEEVIPGGDWPGDGWFRLQPRGGSVDVRAVRPGAADPGASEALYVRLPGTALQQGERAAYAAAEVLARPRLETDYELTLGATRFQLRVESGAKGMQYAIGYGGRTYTYLLGPFDATRTGVRAVADLDGDSYPDFLVDVDQLTYLLLSTRALPGYNRPAAQSWALDQAF